MQSGKGYDSLNKRWTETTPIPRIAPELLPRLPLYHRDRLRRTSLFLGGAAPRPPWSLPGPAYSAFTDTESFPTETGELAHQRQQTDARVDGFTNFTGAAGEGINACWSRTNRSPRVSGSRAGGAVAGSDGARFLVADSASLYERTYPQAAVIHRTPK